MYYYYIKVKGVFFMQCSHCGAEVGSEYRLCPFCRCELEYPDKHIIINNYYNSGNHNQENIGNPNNSLQGAYNNPRYQQPQNQVNYNNVQHYNPVDINKSPYDKTLALILCFILGFLGVHRFYVGKNMSGLIYLFTFGVFGMGWMLDIIIIFCGQFTDSKGKRLY